MRKTISLFIAVIMLVSMIPVASLPSAATGYGTFAYVNASGISQEEKTCYIIDGTETELDESVSSWYAAVDVGDVIEWEYRINVRGNVNLILCDSSALMATCGITVRNGNSLTIWAQTGGTGILYSLSTIGGAAGIGSGGYDEPCGTITINGGTVAAIGCYDEFRLPVGIGDSSGDSIDATSGELVINNGDVTAAAYSTKGVCACGDGVRARSITVNDGAITAHGGRYGINIGNVFVEHEGYVHAQTGGIRSGGELRINNGRFSSNHSVIDDKNHSVGDWEVFAESGITIGLKMEVSDPEGATIGAKRILDSVGNNIAADITISPITVPRFRGHSVTLTDEIGVDFYIVLPDGASYPGSYMEFETGNRVISRVNLTDASLEASGKYKFTCFISSIQMADKITPKFHYGEGTEIGESYSACDYLDYVIDNKADYTSKLIDLVKAIADYGHYAQIRLSQLRGWTYGVDYKTIPRFTDDALNVTAVRTAVAGNTVSKTIDDTVINKITYSMDFLSNPMIYLYVEPVGSEIDGFSASEGSKTLDWEIRSDGRYRIKVNAGMIDRIHNTHTVTIKSGDSTVATVTFSGLSYIKSALDYCALHPGDPESSPEENFMTAFYRFHSAARAYTSN